jgi:hypothetical protein
MFKPLVVCFPQWRSITFLSLVLLAAVPSAHGQAPTPAAPQTDNSDAAEKAAARKKKFDEARRRLEQGQGATHGEAPSDPNQTLFVSAAKVNMRVGETHAFCVFDIGGRLLTNSAEWTLSSSAAAFVPGSGRDPEIISKIPGTVTLRAKVEGKTAEAEINIIEGEMPTGTVLWSAAQIPGFQTQKIVPAVPSARGPDAYITEGNAKGEVLLRAMLSDGRQLWMKKYSAGSAPSSITPTPTGVITSRQRKP